MKATKILFERNFRRILNFVDFEIEKGITLIVGPNASGKSTLLKILAGIYTPKRGFVFLDNKDVTHLPPSERLKLGIVLAPERMRIALNLTVDENLSFSRMEKAYELFPELEKIKNRRGKDLSGGERQMVVLARALAMEGKYFLLDEPFQGLHESYRRRILEVLPELSKKSAIAIATHDEIEEVLEIANDVYILVGGEVKFSGKKSEGERIVREMFL